MEGGWGLREGGWRRKVLSDWRLVLDGVGRRCFVVFFYICVVIKGLFGYVRCFIFVS